MSIFAEENGLHPLKDWDLFDLDLDPVDETVDRISLWTALLGIEPEGVGDIINVSHQYLAQVKLDVDRSFTILSHVNSSKPVDIAYLRTRLNILILRVLSKHPSLHYYQGYHDIALIVLLVCYNGEISEDGVKEEISEDGVEELSESVFDHSPSVVDLADTRFNTRESNTGYSYPESAETGSNDGIPDNTGFEGALVNAEDLAFTLLEYITINHLRDFMLKDIQLSINHLRLIPAILSLADPELFDIIKQSSHSPFYDYNFFPALSSIITWFSHDLSCLDHILKVWDFIFSYNSVIVNIFIYTAFLINKREMILELGLSDSSDSDSSDSLHTLVSPTNLFSNITDLELSKILDQTKLLIESIPLSDLPENTFPNWFGKYNINSVLTTTSILELSTIEKYELYKKTKRDLPNIIKLQDIEVANQKDVEIDELQARLKEIEDKEALAENEALSSSIDSQQTLVSSDFDLASSFTSKTSTLLTSTPLKKLFSRKPNDDKINPKFTNFFFKNIYGISLAIGFFGFFIHFIMIKNDYNSNFLKFTNINPLRYISANGVIEQVLKLSEHIWHGVGLGYNNAVQFIQESNVVHRVIAIGTIGLGNIVHQGIAIGAIGIGNVRNSFETIGLGNIRDSFHGFIS